MKIRHPIIVAVLLLLLAGCERPDALAEIKARGELVVVTRNSPTTYYLDRSGPTGFEYALAERLAQELDVSLRMEVAYNLPDIFTKLQRHQADIAAAGLTLTEERAALHPHSLPYRESKPQVIYRYGKIRPRSIPEMVGRRIIVLAGSSHAEMMRSLQNAEVPDLQWLEIDEGDTTQLMELLNAGQADLAIIDSDEFVVQQGLFPRLRVAFDLTSTQKLVWYLPAGIDNTRLLAFIDDFMYRQQKDGSLARLHDTYFGHTGGLALNHADEFALHVRELLPTYEALIKEVANEYQLDWQLLAALAYKESQWNPVATSPTGVRGMMMLTNRTAREMGVDNRLDAAQSLRGGARYLKELSRRLPRSIQEPDRTWMALAAYNVGLGHLEDARILTQRQGGDPDLWQDVMARLPLLQQAQYYKASRYGYTRGREAVTLVQRIRQYRTILARQEMPERQPPPPLRAADYLPEMLKDTELQVI